MNFAEGKGLDSFTDVDGKSIISSAAGGAVSGFVLASTGNSVLAGALGGLVGNATNQIIDIVTDKEKDWTDFDPVSFALDTAIGAGLGAILSGPSVKGINAGRNSMSATTKSVTTKIANETIKNISLKTSAKIAFSRCWNGALTEGLFLGSFASDGVDYLRDYYNENKSNSGEVDHKINFDWYNIVFTQTE